MMACSAWIALSILVNHGTAQIQFAGITVIEMLGAYMIGRAFVRTESQYRGLVRVLWVLMVILLPAAAIESVTTVQIYTRLFEPIFQTFPWSGYEKRLGLWRAQTVFEHAILYGTFCAFTMAPIWHAARNEGGRIRAWFLALPSLLTTFFCLSLGAWLGVIVQLGLMAWGWVLRSFTWRWSLLGWLAVAAYVTVDILSNRTPFEVFISYLAFDAHTAYWRVLIFTYGMENVWEHPFFGLGLTDWARPWWMTTGTVDNLWLVFAMRYGIPGFFFLIAAYVSVVLALTRARPAAATARVHRDALAFSFIGLAICIATVHLWNATFVFMVFMMGAASWVADAPRDATPAAPRGGADPRPAPEPAARPGANPGRSPSPGPARTAGVDARGSRVSDRRGSAPGRRPAGRV
jgi:O-antigen ligase